MSLIHRLVLALCVAFMPASAVLAQTYPSKPITIIVPFSPGGGVDTVARLLAEKLRTSLNQSVVVDNKAGGSGMIGALAVVKAAPDGHTILLGSAGETAINPHVYKAKMQYDPARDLAPVTLVTRIPNVLVVNAASPFRTVADLLAFAKKNPGKLTYSSSGVGNPQHLNGELLEELAGVHMVHIPYKGAAGQLIDVTTGAVDMTFVSYTAAKGFIESGKVRALGVTSARRTGFVPDIPALSETRSIERYQLENWFGMFAPAGTPQAVVQRLNSAVTQALRDPDLAKRLREQGGDPAPMTAAEFRDFLKAESAQFARIVLAAKVTAE